MVVVVVVVVWVKGDSLLSLVVVVVVILALMEGIQAEVQPALFRMEDLKQLEDYRALVQVVSDWAEIV